MGWPEAAELNPNPMFPPKKHQRPSHRRHATPQGEAQEALFMAERRLAELKQVANSDRMQDFVSRLNDFLHAARSVENYLERENGRPAGFRNWVHSQHRALLQSDMRYKYLADLRNVSDKECVVAPDSGRYRLNVLKEMTLQDSAEAVLDDPKTGEAMLRVSQADGAQGKAVLRLCKVGIEYFFCDWPTQEILTLFDAVLDTLRNLVVNAYMRFPCLEP